MEDKKEKISEAFLEGLVDRVIVELSAKLGELDISLDYIASLLSGEAAISVGAGQRASGRLHRGRGDDRRVQSSSKPEK
tara:strand:- start:408 stop:644 length:237 start_codon:yes stop_codon:yes gene_type:complete